MQKSYITTVSRTLGRASVSNPQVTLSEDYYPYVTRRLLYLFRKGVLDNVTSVDVEPDYGYVARINYVNGTHRIISGYDLGLNTGAAGDLTKDKGFTKFMLRSIGIECSDGEEFLLPHWAHALRRGERQKANTHIQSTDEAHTYIDSHFGYPAYVKPVNGSQGANIFKVEDQAELNDVFELYEDKKIRVAVVEKPFDMPDYRIVMLDGQLISAYRRIPLTIVGDGKRTIEQLIKALQSSFDEQGRDTRISAEDSQIGSYLRKAGMTLGSTPDHGDSVVLTPVSNLSTGGSSVDVSQVISPKWVELAAYVANNFNLRLCGLDLACADIANGESEYCVIEVNAAPGLDHYARSGIAQEKIVDGLYAKVFNAI